MASKKRKHGDAVGEDVHRFRFVPPWVVDLARANGGFQVFFAAAKRVEKSDLSRQQNRLLLPKDYVAAHLLPALSDDERDAANLVGEPGSGGKKKKTYPKKKKQQPASSSSAAATDGDEAEEPKKRAPGREHGGLTVTAFARSGLRFRLRLTRWDSNLGTVVKGDELRLLTALSSLTVGDEIEVWGFRLVDGGDLCFAIGRRA